MQVTSLAKQKERHANNFADGECVFKANKDGKKVEIICRWYCSYGTLLTKICFLKAQK
jgi:hypothetical protein